MKKIIVLYVSMTGNTERMAEEIAGTIAEDAGIHVTIKDALEIEPELLMEYNGILIGAYTWDKGALPDEFLDFYEEMSDLDLTDKKAAVFGSGSSVYGETFGAALDTLQRKLRGLGATITTEALLVDGTPDKDDYHRCHRFGEAFKRSCAIN